MKDLLFFSLLVAVFWGCNNDVESNIQGDDVPDSTEVVMPDVAVEVEQPRNEIVNELEKSSTFFNLGCCEDSKARKENKCCCDEVLKKYGEIREKWSAPQIAELKQKDPIFNDCKSVLAFIKAIEALEKVPDALEVTPEDDPGAF